MKKNCNMNYEQIHQYAELFNTLQVNSNTDMDNSEEKKNLIITELLSVQIVINQQLLMG